MNLVPVDHDALYSRLRPVLSQFDQITGAYHFGSSLDLCRPDSDIDIGLVLGSNVSRSTTREQDLLVEEVLLKMRLFAGHPLDIVILNSLPVVFSFRVLRNGHLFFVREQILLTDFVELVSRRYAEDYPRYEKALKEAAGV